MSSAAVPTVFVGLFQYLDQFPGLSLASLNRCLIGGSAVPRSMIQQVNERLGADTIQAWGMTELNPMGVVCTTLPIHAGKSFDELLELRVKQGRAVFGVEIRIVDDTGEELPRDGHSFGNLQVRGPWVVQNYYRCSESATDYDQWFDTGDVATIDRHGYVQLVDRSKDVIKR